MTKYTKKFSCPNCNGTDFGKNYQFSVDFKTVNFTDELIYDKKFGNSYFCRQCGQIYTPTEIQESLKRTIQKYKTDEWEN